MPSKWPLAALPVSSGAGISSRGGCASPWRWPTSGSAAVNIWTGRPASAWSGCGETGVEKWDYLDRFVLEENPSQPFPCLWLPPRAGRGLETCPTASAGLCWVCLTGEEHPGERGAGDGVRKASPADQPSSTGASRACSQQVCDPSVLWESPGKQTPSPGICPVTPCSQQGCQNHAVCKAWPQGGRSFPWYPGALFSILMLNPFKRQT